jgi:hypothetical protein
MSIALSFTVIGLEQFLYTAPAQFQESPGSSILLWACDSLIALPLFALGIWGGHRIARWRGIGMARRADLLRRALLTAAAVAVVLVPGWFAHNWLDKLTQAEPLVPVHVHGKVIGANLHWVSDPVILALMAVPLLALAGWGGYLIAARARLPLPRTADIAARAALAVAVIAAAPATAWILQKAADRSNSAQVYNTSALLSIHVHSHVRFGDGRVIPLPKGPPVTSAPYAFAYQVAHAFQDALAGLAIGLPVALIALFWIARRLRARERTPRQQVPVLSLREATE